MAEWPRSGPYLRALAEWGFDSRLATRFAILGRNLFASPRARGSFLYYCGVVIIFLTELGVGLIVGNVVAFLWRGAWGRLGVVAWHPPIALTGWGLVELASSGGVSMLVWLSRAGVLRFGMLMSTHIHQLLT
jgi:hypothetical protein